MKTLTGIFVISIVLAAAVTADEARYQVERGETFYSIAHKFNMTPVYLMEINGYRNPGDLKAGDELIIPNTYIVEKGDSLYRIAHDHDLTVYELRELNDFPDGYSNIKEGDVIVVPAKTTPESTRVVEKTGNDQTGTNTGTATVTTPEPETVSATIPPEATMTSVSGEAPFWPHGGVRHTARGKLRGIEFVGNPGDRVYAVATGTVVWRQGYRPYKWLVVIQTDDDYRYFYGFNDEVLVDLNERVTAGTELGTLGIDPSSGEALLLFSVSKDDTEIDPELAPRG